MSKPEKKGPYIIHLYPCVDGLLYAPVYAAILSVLHRHGVSSLDRDQREDGTIEFCCDDDYSVVLHRKAGSDLKALEALVAERNGRNVLHLAIGDPKIPFTDASELALSTASAPSAAPDRRSPIPRNERQFHLVGAFVNRIALWAVCRKSAFRKGNRSKMQSAADALMGRARKREIGLVPLAEHEFAPLRLGYCKKGATTKAVIDRFIGDSFEGPDEEPTDLGKPELEGLIEGAYDITFSFEPWLLQPTLRQLGVGPKARKDFTVLEWFQSVPFPFSGLTVLADEKELEESGEIIRFFIQHMMVGLTFMYRYKRSATQLLKEHSSRLRHFGFETELTGTERDLMVGRAFNRLVVDSDCFSDAIDASITSWDLALASGPLKAALDQVRKCQSRNMLYHAADEYFLNETLPKIHSRLVKKAGLERPV